MNTAKLAYFPSKNSNYKSTSLILRFYLLLAIFCSLEGYFAGASLLRAQQASEQPAAPKEQKQAQASAEPKENKEPKKDVEQEAKEEAEQRAAEIKQTIEYGVDVDLINVIDALLQNSPRLPQEEGVALQWIEETPYNEAIYQRIEKGFSSSELETKAIQFFMQQKWTQAEPFVSQMLQRGFEEENFDNNLLFAALAFVRNLDIKSSEAAVLNLLQHENPQVVERSMVTLGKIGSEESATTIFDLLEDEANSFIDFSNDEQEVLREAAIIALGDLSYSPAAEYLLQILQSDDEAQSAGEWGAAARALGQMEQEAEALPSILQYFRNGNSQERYQAVKALATFSPQPSFTDVILQGLQEGFWKTREEAAKTAGQMQLQETIPSLVYRISNDSVVAVRRASVEALRQMGGSSSTALLELIKDADVGEAPRLEVLRTLIRAREESVLPIFRELINDTENTHKFSRSNLFRLAIQDAWAALDFVYEPMLAGNRQKDQVDALRAIGRERIKSLQPTVKKLADSASNSSVRRVAKTTLGILNS